jgi:two-component system chemotaxis sensor kinase CheA
MYASFDLYSDSIQKINRISSSLQENVMNMRMVPIQMVFSRFPRLIRDLADKLGKKVDLSIEGVETEIDKGMVDDIFDPLIHILRNAIDHGLENPEERRALGKPETGKIVLKAAHEGDSINIEVTDDGKGIDVEKIKSKAVENGFISRENADKLSQKELLSLIFIPGLSTSQTVSDLSGRGVGMDVVKKKIEEIGGSVGVATVKGKGTKIIIRLPLTLAIIQGLLVIVNGMNYVIPVASVDETVILDTKDLKEINHKQTIELRGKFIPILSLMKYFYQQDTGSQDGNKVYCIVSRYGDSLIGILVSEVVGEQDIVIKPLNTKLIKSPGISAATIIGNGDIGYIIDTSQIIGNFFRK